MKDAGFIEAHLHRNTGVGNGSFSFINIARWERADAWRTAHDAYSPGEYRVPRTEDEGTSCDFEPIINAHRAGTGETGAGFLNAASARL